MYSKEDVIRICQRISDRVYVGNDIPYGMPNVSTIIHEVLKNEGCLDGPEKIFDIDIKQILNDALDFAFDKAIEKHLKQNR